MCMYVYIYIYICIRDWASAAAFCTPADFPRPFSRSVFRHLCSLISSVCCRPGTSVLTKAWPFFFSQATSPF